MDNLGSNFVKNFSLMLKSSGGFKVFLDSGYTAFSLVVTFLLWRKIVDGTWPELAFQLLPAMIGFSFASFALYFAVLGDEGQRKLLVREDKLGGMSVLVVLCSSIVRAVAVQLCALFIAMIYEANPFRLIVSRILLNDPEWIAFFHALGYAISAIGCFMLVHSLILILAATLSLLRIVEIKSRP